MSVTLAGAPVSWGVDFADDPGNPPPAVVLPGLAAAGLRHAELGPPGYLPTGALPAHGLAAVGTFVFRPLDDGAATLAAARDALGALTEHGGKLLVLIDQPSGARAATAGRSADAQRLSDPAWREMVETLRRVADLAGRHGIRAVVHPHAGSRIEFADEIDRLLDDLPPEEAGLCLDTGHALYARDDPVALLTRYASRVEHLHLKDVDPARLATARERRTGFWTTMADGVFCPVGDGALDLDGFAAGLRDTGYAGFATIEQDRRPGSPGDPGADLRRSVERLVAAGFTT